MLDSSRTTQLVDQVWSESIVDALTEYIRIPNKSPLYDSKWQSAGHMEKAIALIETWCREQPIRGLTTQIVRLEGRTPLLYMEVPASGGSGSGGVGASGAAGSGSVGASDPGADTVLLYGHYDKQPEMVGWTDGLGPWTPVLRGDKLYGRGGADDGYAAFASLLAIRALQEQGRPHARCVILIEGCEESGSFDLPYYIDHLSDRIGKPSLVVCLDSGCGNYEQLWCTTSLRGNIVGNLRVDVLTEGVHSGDASGVVPSSFRILRQILSRIEDEETGRIIPDCLHVEIPDETRAQAAAAAEIMGEAAMMKYPFAPGVQPMTNDPAEAILNRTWRPTLSYTGIDGIPSLEDGGNVLRPHTSIKLSFRVGPTLNVDAASGKLTALLLKDPPYGAKVSFDAEKGASGWSAPALAPWLESAVDSASQTYFGKPAAYMGEGGSIPFMGMLGEKFPEAQFLITGVLGPNSNAHGPNEFLHIPMARKLTACVADVVAKHQVR